MNGLPRTVSEAVETILGEMKAADKRTLRNTPKTELYKFHSGWGQGIRNSMGLWTSNHELLADTGKSHAKDASMVIIYAVWEALQSMGDAEIEASSVGNENHVDYADLIKIADEIRSFIQQRVPRGVRFAAGCDDDAVSVIVGLVDDSVTEYESSSVRRFSDQ